MFIKITYFLRCINNGIILKIMTVIVMVRELMEEGEGVQRLVQVTNLIKDSFLFPVAKHFRWVGLAWCCMCGEQRHNL